MILTDAIVPVSVIGRVSEILACFTPGVKSLTISELSRRTGLAKSTTSRLVSELVMYGFLEHRGKEIRLGLRFFELGTQATRPKDLRRLTYAHMDQLRRVTGHTVHLAVLDGSHVVYLEILRSRTTPALPSCVGGRVPAHATALGKAMLAFSDPAVAERIIAGGLARVGPRTITDPDTLRATLWRIRSTGVASEQEESTEGVGCVAAPILVDEGEAIAALSVSGMVQTIDEAACTTALRTVTDSLRRQIANLQGMPQDD